MADSPDAIVLKRDRDLEGREHEIWVRRVVLLLLAALSIAALLNVFGQRPSTSIAAAPAAALELYAPTHLRGGLLWSARFDIQAHQNNLHLRDHARDRKA